MIKITQTTQLQILFIFLLFCSTTIIAQVGIGNNNPTTALDVEGSLSLREGGTITLANGNNTNINLGANPYSFYRIIGPTTSFNINSIIPVTGADGQIVSLQNTTDAIMNIMHNTGGAAANRIYVSNQKTSEIRGRYATVTFQYSSAQSKWILINRLDHFVQGYVLVGSAATPPTAAIPPGYYTIIVNVPGATAGSSAYAGLVGNAFAPFLDILNVECRTDLVHINVYNPYTGSLNNVQFFLTVNKL